MNTPISNSRVVTVNSYTLAKLCEYGFSSEEADFEASSPERQGIHIFQSIKQPMHKARWARSSLVELNQEEAGNLRSLLDYYRAGEKAHYEELSVIGEGSDHIYLVIWELDAQLARQATLPRPVS